MDNNEQTNGTGDQTQFPNGPTSASGRIKVAEKDYNIEERSFEILFSDGSKSTVLLSQFKDDIVTALALHGLSQKLGDSYASVKGDVAAAKVKYEAVLSQLLNGEWKKNREGSGEGGAKAGELAEAIARLKQVTIEQATKVVAKATEDQLKTWRATAKIKAEIAQIRAEKAKARADADAAKNAQTGADAPVDPLADLNFDDISA